jgi:pimeloyl-ACP methyl ester carboxylesterase
LRSLRGAQRTPLAFGGAVAIPTLSHPEKQMMMHRAVRPVLLLLLLGPAVRAADAPPIVLDDCLVLPNVGRSGRQPLQLDPVQAVIAAGTWKAPRAGDAVGLPGQQPATWTEAKAKDGIIQHRALNGGYLHWRVRVESDEVRILEASGHLIVLVNGAPRAGDPYGNGLVRLPIALRKGVNDLLFQVGRGRLQARLVTPTVRIGLDVRDATLPDLLRGEKETPWAAVVVTNGTDQPLEKLILRTTLPSGDSIETPLPTVAPLTVRKVGCRVPAAADGAADNVAVTLELLRPGVKEPLDRQTVTVRVRRPEQSHKRTFVSGIDGSVQYYAVQPGKIAEGGPAPALFLTLHGASVEAIGQADAYAPKDWGHIIAPTNRRPYGFDWEDWGGQDALEVLEAARVRYKTDPRRTYLTGHSMGGHGTWIVGVTYPDRWAAIAPSAGWINFATYGGMRRPEIPSPLEELLWRPANQGDTFALVRNCAANGVYVLHGDADDNVPVREAREMRKQLAAFHPDFAYYERPGAGHWWGNECVDWPPLFEFLKRHTLPKLAEVRSVRFTTINPAVSAWCHWAGIELQSRQLQPSTVDLRLDAGKRQFAGTTENVARLALDLTPLPPGEPVNLELDGQRLEKIAWPEKGKLWLQRSDGKWTVVGEPATALKGPHRYGPFKEVFRNRMVLVYGTKGTPEENAWAYAKARFDAETWWYRGNGAVDVLADTAFNADRDRERNVILYGHAESNAAWPALLGDSPVQVRRGQVRVGDRTEKGDDLGCLFVRPRPGSERALVGVVGGTGLHGMRLTDRLPYFVSGVGYPDLVVLGPEAPLQGVKGLRLAGFFGADWSVEKGEFLP